MTGILELLSTVLEQDDTVSLVNYLQSCKEIRCFYNNKDSVPQVITTINKLLNENKTREKGLKLLGVLLPQCSLNEIMGNIISWMQQSLRAVVQNENQHIHATALDVFYSLLESSCQLHEVRPQIISAVIPKFMDMALHRLENQPKKSAVLLKCLEKCFVHFGKSCGNFKTMLQSHILKLLDLSNVSPSVVEQASRCYAYLSLTGAPGPNMENFKTAWTNQNKFLIEAMHSLLDILFDNVNEVQSTYKRMENKDVDLNRITKVTGKSPLTKAQQLTSRFTGLAKSLIYMLKLSFPAVKVVNTDAILSVVCRVLAVTCTTLQTRMSAEVIALMTQIPTLHIWCIKSLEAMIHCCRDRAIKHSTIVCKLLTQSLKWTLEEESDYGQDRPYISVRAHAYNCLTTWLTIARSGSGIENYVDDIKSGIISDISPSKPIVTLTLDKNTKGKGKLKKRQRNALQKMGKQQPKCLSNSQANKDVCSAALKSLTIIFESASTLLKAKFHKEMQEVIIKQLLQLQLSHTIPIPYSDDKCRLALYTVLNSINNNFHAQCPPPFHLSSVIFNKGLKDPSLKVMQFCSFAVRNLSNILCPISPGMTLPTSINEKLRDDSLETRHPVVLHNKHQSDNGSSQMYVDEIVELNGTDTSVGAHVEKNVHVLDEDNLNTSNQNKKFKSNIIENSEPAASDNYCTSDATNNSKETNSKADNQLTLSEIDTTPKSSEEDPKEKCVNESVIEKETLVSTQEKDSSSNNTSPSHPSERTNSDMTVPTKHVTECEYVSVNNGTKNKQLNGVDNEVSDEAPRKKFKTDTDSGVTLKNSSPDNAEEEEMLLSFVDEV